MVRNCLWSLLAHHQNERGEVMKLETRKKASNIGAIVGGVGALLDIFVNQTGGGIIDIVANSAIWCLIVYGVCSLIIKVRGEK